MQLNVIEQCLRRYKINRILTTKLADTRIGTIFSNKREFVGGLDKSVLDRLIVRYVKKTCPNKYVKKLTSQQINRKYKQFQQGTCNM